jgi:predicted ATPase
MVSASPSSAPGNAGAPGGGAPAPARWQLRLLGAFELSDGRQRLTRLASRPMVALLARLALAPERNHPREELVELLWPGVDPQVSRNRLRQTLSVLRSVLEPPSEVLAPVLQADRHDVRLVRGAIECDVVAFEREARLGRAAQALALYRGELLPGFFDEWVLDERQRLEAVSERLAEHVAAASLGAGPVMAPAALEKHGREPALPPAPAAAPARRAAPPVYLTRHFLPEALRKRWLTELAAHRLVTLLGPGGSGKTRLAVELAQAAPHVDGVAFVSLVACETRAQALDAIGAALGVAGQGVRDGPDEGVEHLVLALHERPLLLVLDNFEQLVEQATDVVARLAGALPRLRLVITSRRALGIDGERALPVPTLALPEPGRRVALAEALANPAVALFVDRAQHVRADFHLGEQNKAAVLDLVRALEGLPLAIELAASRVRSLAPGRILELLAAGEAPRLELLARSGPRGAFDARHASMERVIRWSWQQLSADEAGLMHSLAVFAGGCSAAAAAAVRGITPLSAALQLDALVACSMLRVTEMPWGEMRFELFEPIREFARMDLRQAGAAGAEAGLRAAHRAWMLEWAETLPSTPSLPALRAELPNLSAALHSALADGDAMSAVRTVLALGRAHDDLVLGADSLAYLEQAVARCEDAELRSRGHTQLAQLLFTAARGDEARRHAELGLEQVPDEPGLRARALHVKARLQWLLVGHAAWLESVVDDAEALARAAQETQVLARLTVLRAAITYAHRRDLVQGEALYRDALAMWERLGNRHAINAGRYFVALIADEAGRHEEAIQRADEVVASARQLSDTRRVSQALQVRGKALTALRRWSEAAATLHESIQLAWDAMAPVELTRAMRDLPRVLAHLRHAEAAVRLQAYAARAAEAHVGRADQFDAHQERRVRRLVAGRVDAARWEALRREGAALGAAEAVALALAETAGG